MSDRFDQAIDRAVREMLDVEPPTGLRGRVLERIEQPRRTLGWAWLVAPAAAAALIGLAVLLPGRQPVPPVAPQIARIEPRPSLPPTPSADVPQRPETASALLPHGAPARAVRSTSQPEPLPMGERLIVAAVSPADTVGSIDPLAPITPITVTPARPRDIAPNAIAISPLALISELQITPLTPPDGRN